MVNAQQNNRVASTALLSCIKAMAQPMPPRMQFLMRMSHKILKFTVEIQKLTIRWLFSHNLMALI